MAPQTIPELHASVTLAEPSARPYTFQRTPRLPDQLGWPHFLPDTPTELGLKQWSYPAGMKYLLSDLFHFAKRSLLLVLLTAPSFHSFCALS